MIGLCLLTPSRFPRLSHYKLLPSREPRLENFANLGSGATCPNTGARGVQVAITKLSRLSLACETAVVEALRAVRLVPLCRRGNAQDQAAKMCSGRFHSPDRSQIVLRLHRPSIAFSRTFQLPGQRGGVLHLPIREGILDYSSNATAIPRSECRPYVSLNGIQATEGM